MKVVLLESGRRRFPGWYSRLIGRFSRSLKKYGFVRVKYRPRRF